MLIPSVFVLIFFAYLRADPYDSPNVKTVLFQDYDLVKHCWNHDDINLLAVRRIMQDLIPKRIPRNIPVLLNYLQMCVNVTENLVTDKKMQDLVRTALYDVLGGYLQAIAVPIANEAYYAGNVDYKTVAELHYMLDDFKFALSTDGGAWSRQCDMSRIPTKVAPLDLIINNPEAACSALFLRPAAENSPDTVNSKISRITLPYFDNNAEPNAIAVPFRIRNLVSLSSPSSVYILVRYYYIVMRCISTEHSEDIIQFNHLYHQWITSKVVPHLHDLNKWYPGFGGVMRIMETMNQRGLSSQYAALYAFQGHQSNMMEQHEDMKIPEFEGSSVEKEGIKETCFSILDKLNIFHLQNTLFYSLLFLLFLLLLLLLLLCCCSCCVSIYEKLYLKSTLNANDDATKFSGPYNGILSVYCGIKDSKSSQKGDQFNTESVNLVKKKALNESSSSNNSSSTIRSDTLNDTFSKLKIDPLLHTSPVTNFSDTEIEDEEEEEEEESESTY